MEIFGKRTPQNMLQNVLRRVAIFKSLKITQARRNTTHACRTAGGLVVVCLMICLRSHCDFNKLPMLGNLQHILRHNNVMQHCAFSQKVLLLACGYKSSYLLFLWRTQKSHFLIQFVCFAVENSKQGVCVREQMIILKC